MIFGAAWTSGPAEDLPENLHVELHEASRTCARDPAEALGVIDIRRRASEVLPIQDIEEVSADTQIYFLLEGRKGLQQRDVFVRVSATPYVGKRSRRIPESIWGRIGECCGVQIDIGGRIEASAT